MEKKRSIDWGLINELTHGKELAEQLSNHLINPSSPSATHHPDFLLAEILSCYNKVISALSSGPAPAEASTVTAAGGCASPNSVTDLSGHTHKKRKTVPRWTQQVQAPSCSSAGTALQGPLDDGYSWRKYGQKDIYGAAFPRAYYRCTHRNSQGCLATKQVQKSDQDPTVFDVSYRGRHTCVHSTRPQESVKQEPQDQINFGAGLKVETQRLDHSLEDDILSSFSFPCDPVGFDEIFSFDGGRMAGYSPAFMSPATSGGSNYFSDLTVSAGTSAANSPVGDFNFSFDNLESFSFSFENPQL